MNTTIDDIDPRMNDRAVSVYDGNATDEFPVLKAFQQYIDAEQAKARKRMMMICLFFSFIMMVVIAVFVVLLVVSTSRSQALNDRLVEYAMRERATAVSQPPPKDDAVLRALTDKLENLQETLRDERERSRQTAETKPAEKTRPTAEAMEIERLKLLLATEKERALADREKLRQAELEAYRRKHYPEAYREKTATPLPAKKAEKSRYQREEEEIDREIDDIVGNLEAISYFDETDEDEDVRPKDERKAEKSSFKTSERRQKSQQQKNQSSAIRTVSPSQPSASPSPNVTESSGTVSVSDSASFVIP